MEPAPEVQAAIAQPSAKDLILSGRWTARCIDTLQARLQAIQVARGSSVALDATRLDALDTAGAWLLQALLQRLRADGAAVDVRGMRAGFAALLEAVSQQAGAPVDPVPPGSRPRFAALEQVGRRVAEATSQATALLAFVGENALVLASCLAHPTRLRWRPILFNIRSAGFDALPIVGLLSFLLGVVVARAQLGVSYSEFLDRFAKAISVTSYLIGIGKAPVFAAIIAVVGCFQGMRTRGGPDSVGRQTTRSVVQGIFLVIVADALFSVAFSLLDL